MGRTCFCAGCKSGYSSEYKRRRLEGTKMPSLFTPPKNLEIFEMWKRCIPRADRELTRNDFVCSRHFKEEDIERFYETKMPDGTIVRIQRGTVSLKPDAIPSLFPDTPGHSSYGIKEVKNQIDQNDSCVTIIPPPPLLPPPKQKKKRKRKVTKDYSIQSGKENILFEGIILHPIQSPPKSQPVLSKEREDNKNEGYNVSSNPQTCFINQSESYDMMVDHRSLLLEGNDEDGNEVNSPPSALQNSISESESPFIDLPTGDESVEDCSAPSMCETSLTESNVLPKSVTEEKFSFQFLKINVNMVDTLNPWWKVNVLDDFISFIRWAPDYTIERRIVITKDLAVKVFLKDRETTIGSDIKVLSIDAISRLIFRVERSIICSGVDKKDRNCAGFLQGIFMCKRYNLCLNCIKWEKERTKIMKDVLVPNNLVELIRINFDN